MVHKILGNVIIVYKNNLLNWLISIIKDGVLVYSKHI